MKSISTPNGLILATALWICSTAFTPMAYADGGKDKFTPGFSGSIELGIGVMIKESLDAVGDENKKIDSLDQSAESETEFVPFPSWHLQYVLDNQSTKFFAGSTHDTPTGGGALASIGISQYLPGGTILSIAYAPSLLSEEVWADPFKTGSDRTEVDMDSQAFTLEAESILGSNFDIRYGYATVDVDDERSGSYLKTQGTLTDADLKSLDRNGNIHGVEVAYTLQILDQAMLQPVLKYKRADMDGDANSYNEYGGGLTLSHPWGPLHMFYTIAGGVADYESEHAVFDKTREDTYYKAMVGANLPRPFGWENMDFQIVTGYEVVDSNITYYDSNALIFGMGMGWNF
ncbi:MAG: DUF2860 domain-containing protein [Desulfobacterales bacterium]|nr:DUF2860 domain-containing protein [Desulfobacterales bacterium]